MHECKSRLDITELQRQVAVLESRLNGVERDVKDIKDLVKDNTDDIKEIKQYFNKLIIGGLSSAVLLLIGIVINIIISSR